MNFVQQYTLALATEDDIDDHIEFWHDSSEDLGDLHEYLGFTYEQYCKWVIGKESLDEILGLDR